MIWSGVGAPGRAANAAVASRMCLLRVEPERFAGKVNEFALLRSTCPPVKTSLVEPQQVAISMNWIVPSALLKTSSTRHKWTPLRAGALLQSRMTAHARALDIRGPGFMAALLDPWSLSWLCGGLRS